MNQSTVPGHCGYEEINTHFYRLCSPSQVQRTPVHHALVFYRHFGGFRQHSCWISRKLCRKLSCQARIVAITPGHLTLHSGTTHCQHFKEGSGASRQATAPLPSPQMIQRGNCPDVSLYEDVVIALLARVLGHGRDLPDPSLRQCAQPWKVLLTEYLALSHAWSVQMCLPMRVGAPQV